MKNSNARIAPLQGLRGMNDVLPAQEDLWRYFEETVAAVLTSYGYQQIRTPILEPTALFLRGIGEVTDIVEKEMYSFTDALNGEKLTLRPESTAGVVRAVIEHHLLREGPQRLWYQGPMFRHERPQRGRYRQFHQVGAEALGFEGPDIDAELILVCARLWEELGLKDIQLEINSLGQTEERIAHRQALIEYFEAQHSRLDDDARRRLHTNPLRILDSKNPQMQALIEGAPRIDAFLGAASRSHFEGLQAFLSRSGQSFEVNSRLVRGLDYYNLSVFEWVASSADKPALTVCGGGRYDGLIETLGGKPAPGCGFAIGVERILDLLQAHLPKTRSGCDVYVVHQAPNADLLAMELAEQLRDHGLDVVLHCGGGSFKSQFRRADASGAAYAVVLGEEEMSIGQASVKDLRNPEKVQTRVSLNDTARHILEVGFGLTP